MFRAARTDRARARLQRRQRWTEPVCAHAVCGPLQLGQLGIHRVVHPRHVFVIAVVVQERRGGAVSAGRPLRRWRRAAARVACRRALAGAAAHGELSGLQRAEPNERTARYALARLASSAEPRRERTAAARKRQLARAVGGALALFQFGGKQAKGGRACRCPAAKARCAPSPLPCRVSHGRRGSSDAVRGARGAERRALELPLGGTPSNMELVVDAAVCARRVKALYAAWKARALRETGCCEARRPQRCHSAHS